MDTRSTNVVGYTHFTGDVTAHVGSSHGARLSGGSTGGVVEAVGDDANIALRLRGKGSGAVISSNVQVGSTFGLQFIQRQIVQIDTAVMVLAADAAADTVVTVTGATTNALCVFAPHATFSSNYFFQAMCSTADEVRVRIYNHSASTFGSGESSNRGTLYVIG